jgi:hypothetical protein
MIPTHAVYVNGRTWMAGPGIDRGEENDIAKMLGRLDGSRSFSLLLWKLPPGKHLDETNPGRDANEYIQCAGSAERMTVEVRRLAGGTYEHFVVGRGPNGENRGIEETIDWDGVKTLVAPNEVFSAEEAAELFHSYYRTGWVPSRYVLRLLSL